MRLSPSPQYFSLSLSLSLHYSITSPSFLSPLNTAAHLLAFSTPSSLYSQLCHTYIHTYLTSLSPLYVITLKFKLRYIINHIMSSRRSRSGGISDDQIADLIHKLHQLVPELRRTRSSHKASANKVLQETCNYIRSLHREVDDLSDRLSELLASTDTDSAQAAIIRSLLM